MFSFRHRHAALATSALLALLTLPARADAQDAAPAGTSTGNPISPAAVEKPAAGQVAPEPATAPPPPPAASAPAPAPSAAVSPAVSPAPAPCEPCRRRDHTEGAGGFMLGVIFIDLSELNDHLRLNGYEELESAMTIIGGDAHAVFPSGIVAGGRGAGILAPSADGPGSVRASFGGGFGMGEIGYAFVHTRALLLTLLGGVGGYGLSVDLSEHRTLAFDDVLADPRRTASLSYGGLLFSATLGFDGRIPIGDVDREGVRPFFSVGLRAGGMYGPPISEWSLSDGTELSGAPSTTFASAFAAVVLSFGGMPADTM